MLRNEHTSNGSCDSSPDRAVRMFVRNQSRNRKTKRPSINLQTRGVFYEKDLLTLRGRVCPGCCWSDRSTHSTHHRLRLRRLRDVPVRKLRQHSVWGHEL